MEILSEIASLLVAIVIAFTAGKLIAKLRLPSILGWLIAGMAIGPHALNILGNSVWKQSGLEFWRAFLNVHLV